MPRPRARVPTPSQTVGPFYGFALPFDSDADAVTPGTPGAIRIEGRLLDGAGEAVRDGLIEVWADEQFARCRTDLEGAFHFSVRKPAPALHLDGHVAAPHLNVTVFARGLLRHVATLMYFPDEAKANSTDPILELVEPARRHTLVARNDGGALEFDVRLQGEGETVFFEL